MPQHERGRGGRGTEPGGRKPEGQPLPYYLAASFLTRDEAQEPYHRAQELIHLPAHDLELSAFSFERRPRDSHQPPLPRPWFVVVLGDAPEEAIQQQFQEILGTGELTQLSLETIVTLAKRRESETRKGDWTEGHYGAGKILPEATIKVQRRNPNKDKLKRKQQQQSRRRNRGT